MIQNIDRTDRRILKFPAVSPCEGILPATLLTSLITLSQTIYKHQSKFFPTQRKNARETFRQIGNLLIFLEEIRENSVLSDSVILCFSELHFTFQKIQFLLEDCTREGARLWILMKSQFIAAQFRVLIRAIATALDVLPLNLIDVSAEVKELVELVARQARKAKLELEQDDESVSNQVISILNRFEKGIEPELGVSKRVLDYLEIRGWKDCDKEIKFLDQEIGLDCDDGREVPFLCSLMGFMCYCRGVVFETSDFQNANQVESKFNVEVITCLNPEDFRCPISLELMTDPVTVSTGQTYDRSSIEKWLKAGNTTCPKTGEKLKNTELVTNYSLRRLIQQFCGDHGISMAKSGRQNRDISRTVIAGSSAAAESMKILAKFLSTRIVFGSDEQKNKAAYEIRLLAKSNIFNRSCLIEAETIPPLLELLSSPDSSTQENAISAILKLSKHSKGKKTIIKKGLGSIIEVLKNGLKLESKQIAAATLFYLSSVQENRKLIGGKTDAIPAFVKLIEEGTACGKKNATVAIFALLLYGGNHQKVLEAGTVPVLVDLLAASCRADLITDTLAILAALAEQVEGTVAILQTSALPIILEILKNSSTSRAGQEYCVSTLLSCCINGGFEVISGLSKDRSLPSSLYNLVTEGTSHASKKARSLLKILHKHCETSSSGLATCAVFHEPCIHA